MQFVKKITLIFLILMILIVFTQPVADAASNGKTFKDVSPNNTNYEIINSMSNKGIIGGYEDGTFRPGAYITRKQAAALISRAFPKLINVYDPKELKDLTKSNPYFNDLNRMYESALLLADKGNIRPNDNLTRAEMALILANTYGFYDDTNVSNNVFNHPFTDLRLPNDPQSIIINNSVAGLYIKGITTGYEDKTFRPNEPVTRAQFAVFMYRSEQAKNDTMSLLYDILAFQYTSHKNVPLPSGYIDAQSLLKVQTKVYGSFSYNNNFDYKAGHNMHFSFNYTFANDLERISNNFSIEVSELVRIINYVFTTGEVYTSSEDAPIPFAVYYNFTDGFICYGSDPDPSNNIVH